MKNGRISFLSIRGSLDRIVPHAATMTSLLSVLLLAMFSILESHRVSARWLCPRRHVVVVPFLRLPSSSISSTLSPLQNVNNVQICLINFSLMRGKLISNACHGAWFITILRTMLHSIFSFILQTIFSPILLLFYGAADTSARHRAY